MGLYKLLAGKHSQGSRSKQMVFVAGEIIESDVDLVRLFGKEKFEKVSSREATPSKGSSLLTSSSDEKPEPAPAKAQEEEPEKLEDDVEGTDIEKDDEEDEETKEPIGEDVTDDFVEEGSEHKVYRKGTKYFVTDLKDNILEGCENGIKRLEVKKFLADQK